MTSRPGTTSSAARTRSSPRTRSSRAAPGGIWSRAMAMSSRAVARRRRASSSSAASSRTRPCRTQAPVTHSAPSPAERATSCSPTRTRRSQLRTRGKRSSSSSPTTRSLSRRPPRSPRTRRTPRPPRRSWTTSSRRRASRSGRTTATGRSTRTCWRRTRTSSRRFRSCSRSRISAAGRRSKRIYSIPRAAPWRRSRATSELHWSDDEVVDDSARQSWARSAARIVASVAHSEAPPGRVAVPRLGGPALTRGLVIGYLSILVLMPIAAVVLRSTEGGWDAFWTAISNPQAFAAIKLTFVVSLIVVAVNAVTGTIIAWVLVRDQFPGKRIVNSLIDLPFALPTIVAGLTLLALYGDNGVLGLSGVAFTRIGVVMALLFVTLPFVIRSVQPVLLELDRDMEEAAASLGAGPFVIFRRIILPNLMPAMVSGTALAFTRSIAEFGSTVLISGNLPFKTQVAAVHIFGQIESDNTTGAAAVATVLLAVALAVLVILDLLQRWGARRA